MTITYRDYTFLGTTQSLCPECLALVPAKIVSRDGRVYFRKRCSTHGEREDFVCSDVRWFDRTDFSLPGKVPEAFGVVVDKGCPYDCGLCTEHEQHTCIGLLEITSSCNLECPMCFAVSGPGGTHLTVDECRRAIDRLVEVEGEPEILQLSGGEPTTHPDFFEILDYAVAQPIDIVMINTNGIRIARDQAFVERLAKYKQRVEVYLQFDSFDESGVELLRGKPLVETKLQAIERLGEIGMRTILVCTLQPGVNDHEMGRLVQFGTERSWITGVSFQPATYSGRYVLPAELERRITFPDVIKGIESQTDSQWLETDFTPLPCAHPNGHTLAYAYRKDGLLLPLARFVDLENHLDLLSGRITFNRPRARKLIAEYLSRQPCCLGGCDEAFGINGQKENDRRVNGISLKTPLPFGERMGEGLNHRGTLPSPNPSLQGRGTLGTGSSHRREVETAPAISPAAEEFFERALVEDLAPEDVFRVTTTSFMDAYNFDVRQLMKSCVHHLLPTGHIIPFSAYNVLYRDGHVPLPPLLTSGVVKPQVKKESTPQPLYQL